MYYNTANRKEDEQIVNRVLLTTVRDSYDNYTACENGDDQMMRKLIDSDLNAIKSTTNRSSLYSYCY